MRILSALIIVASLSTSLSLIPSLTQATGGTDEDVYQIVKATPDRVWRLNKKTGEIAVCTLDGDNLVCTTSSEAIKPPTPTYEEREAEKRQAAAEAVKRREIEKAKDLEFLDRVIAAFRILIGAAIERDGGK